jgi:hypothetical protein
MEKQARAIQMSPRHGRTNLRHACATGPKNEQRHSNVLLVRRGEARHGFGQLRLAGECAARPLVVVGALRLDVFQAEAEEGGCLQPRRSALAPKARGANRPAAALQDDARDEQEADHCHG